MNQPIVRNVDPGIVKALERRAASHGRSAEVEHREILRAALADEPAEGAFKSVLGSMPDVGTDADFETARNLLRSVA